MRIFLPLIFYCLICSSIQAEVYKCIDAAGRVSYSNIPCPEGTNKKQLESLGSYTNQSDESYEEDIDYQQDIEEIEPAPRQNSQNVLHISNGERVNLLDHLEYGKYTAFFFYAPWCPHCRKARPEVQASANTHETMVLREINIVDWKSPVKNQYQIPSIPYFKLYDKSGKLISEGSSSSSDTYKYLLNPALLK